MPFEDDLISVELSKSAMIISERTMLKVSDSSKKGQVKQLLIYSIYYPTKSVDRCYSG